MTESAPKGAFSAGRPRTPRKFIIGGAIIVLVVAYLIFSNVGGSSVYYLTVAELKAQGAGAFNRKVRVAGTVAGDTIQWDEQNLLLRFDIVDESGRLPVIYHGARPDMFRDGAEAVVEGKLNAQGVFEAQTLLLKCPSKYQEAATARASSSQ